MTSEGKNREGEADGDAGILTIADSPMPAGADPEGDDMGAPRTEESAERFVGRVLSGRYRIDVHLGSGGFGDVYRAIQEKTGQLVAIKLLRPRYGRGAPSLDRQLARFRREMRVCAELHHAHIVRLIDSGETDGGVVFSVFEYVPGTTLAELLREKGALTVRTAIELMAQVLDALICAHGKGIIHRDLKPNNIMVSTTGSRPQTTVLDFGISAFREGMMIDEFRSLTVTREVLGTPSYAAPEQLRGESASVKSDLYSWGLVFAECLVGRRVFDGTSSLEIAYRQLAADPVPLPEPLQKHWLGTLLRWVLEKDISRRAGEGTLVMERLLEKRPLGDLVNAQGYLLLNESADSSVTTAPASEPRTRNAAGTLPGGERRQMTALCCNIALSPSAAQSTPEQLDQRLRDTLAECLNIATRYGGYAASNLGGQVLIYFGFPTASDSDARRSGIVALEIAHEMRRSATEMVNMPVQVQIGIHTGMVTSYGHDARTSPVVGVTPTKAVQLAGQAPPNGILVSGDSFKHLTPTFDLRALTTAGGEQAYLMVAENRAESAEVGQPSTPFVGREQALCTLESAWQQTRKGRGTTVVVAGEAGIGKSRLAREMRARLHAGGSGWIEARCMPENENSALRPISDMVVQELDLSASEPAQNARRLEASLANLGFEPADTLPLLCLWLGLPLLEPHLPLAFSPQKQKAMLLDLLARLVVEIAERKSAAILIEDLHWADPTTNELVNLLVERVPGRRALLIVTERPDPARKWPEEIGSVLELPSLGRPEVEKIVDALTSGQRLPGKLVSDVVDRADGIPLFVEEIVHLLRSTDILRGTASGNLGQPEVPGKLRDLLTGRLDRLGRAKETAQIAAAIGREFDYRLLANLVPGDESNLLADLEDMVTAELVVRRRHVDNPVYIFRHALLRDAAYGSLLQNVQQELHRKIADTLRTKFPEVAEAQPELMASHYERGGLVRESIGEWLRAGRRGLDTANNRETIAHLGRALALLPGISDEAERLRRELDLQLTLAPALMAIEGWASPRTGAACSRARDLCEALGDNEKLFPALWGLWTFQFVGGDLGPALETAQRTLAIAQAAQSPMIEIAARHAVGFTQNFRGQLIEAQQHGSAALALFDIELERKLARSFQLSSTVACAYFRATSLWMQGHWKDAETGFSFMHDLARQLDHSPSIAAAMGFALICHQYQQDVPRVRTLTSELAALSKDQGFQTWQAVAFVYGAWVRAKDGEVEQGIKELREGIHLFKYTGSRLLMVGLAAMLGEALLLAGRPEEALVVLAEGLEDAAAREEHILEPDLHRLRGDALVTTDPAQAEASFRMAMQIAHHQQARSLSLRAAIALARLLAQQGRPAEARDLLQNEYHWFNQESESPDLAQARHLLESLSVLLPRA